MEKLTGRSPRTPPAPSSRQHLEAVIEEIINEYGCLCRLDDDIHWRNCVVEAAVKFLEAEPVETNAERTRVIGLLDYYNKFDHPFLASLTLAVRQGAFVENGEFHCGCGQKIEFGGPQHACNGDNL